MKTFLTLLITLLAYVHSNAQCNVVTDKLTNGLSYQAARERVFRNEDLENGLKSAAVCLQVNRLYDGNSYFREYFLNVYTASTETQQQVTPRQIKIQLTDGTLIVLKADKFIDINPVKSVRMDACNFKMTYNDYDKLRSVALKEIVIIDSRTGFSIICNPFKGIFQEQAICIDKATP